MINLKIEKQTKGLCGPYSLKMVAGYYGVHKSIDELAELLRATPDSGCLQQDIVAGAQSLGFEVTYKQRSSIVELKSLE